MVWARFDLGLTGYVEEMKFPTALDDSLVYEYVKVKADFNETISASLLVVQEN